MLPLPPKPNPFGGIKGICFQYCLGQALEVTSGASTFWGTERDHDDLDDFSPGHRFAHPPPPVLKKNVILSLDRLVLALGRLHSL